MKILRYFLLLMAAVTMAAGFTACINDDISTSPSDQPTFSVDTLKMGTVFTEDVTVTHKFTVRNRNDKGINISDIRLSGPNADLFRLNVDGLAGKTFQNVEIRANDSIYVFVEATLPANGGTTPQTVNATVDFLTNGVTSHVVLRADGQDVTRLRALTITEDTHLTKGRPYQIFDSLVVAEGRTLTLDPGADLRFHDGATFIVRGTLICNGTLRDPVSIAGDRTGNVITDITFDLMSRQWNGLQFTVSSHGNRMVHTHLRNTWYGVIVSGDGKPSADGAPKLWLQNTRLRNSGDLVLEVYDADVQAYGCEFAEAANGVVRLQGGSHIFNHCTFARERCRDRHTLHQSADFQQHNLRPRPRYLPRRPARHRSHPQPLSAAQQRHRRRQLHRLPLGQRPALLHCARGLYLRLSRQARVSGHRRRRPRAHPARCRRRRLRPHPLDHGAHPRRLRLPAAGGVTRHTAQKSEIPESLAARESRFFRWRLTPDYFFFLGCLQ